MACEASGFRLHTGRQRLHGIHAQARTLASAQLGRAPLPLNRFPFLDVVSGVSSRMSVSIKFLSLPVTRDHFIRHGPHLSFKLSLYGTEVRAEKPVSVSSPRQHMNLVKRRGQL